MDKSLGYLREALSNYSDRYPTCRGIYHKIDHEQYPNEEELIKDLSDEEMKILNVILKHEIQHAQSAQDEKRTAELNEVYELLF